MDLTRRRVLLVLCVLGVVAGCRLEAARLEGVGDADVLWPMFMGKRTQDAARLAARERRPVLSAAALGLYLRLEKAPTSPEAIKTILAVSGRRGMRDRVALMLAFREEMQGANGKALINNLMASRSGTAHELAAAVLATRYCHAYVARPNLYFSARNDQKNPATAALRSAVKAAGKGKGKKRPAGRGGRGALPPIPDALLASGRGDAYTLAVVAAAFSGDAAYRERMNAVANPAGTAAGAVLLFLARQGEPVPEARVAELFNASMQTERRAARGAPAEGFSPMLPGGCLACMAIAELGEKAHMPLLVKAMAVTDLRVQMDAVRALRRLGPDETALAPMSKMLAQAPWPLLVELCATFGANPDKRLVPSLVARLEKEKGRFRLDLVHALSAIAGEQKASTGEEWKKWAQANLLAFEVDQEASRRYRDTTRVQDVNVMSLGFFYGLPIYSDHLVYVVDTSLSMKGARMESLRENLVMSIDSLQPKGRGALSSGGNVYYNIVDFGGDVVTMYPRRLTTEIRVGKQRAETMPMTYGTRSYDAIEQAMDLAGADTLYFLSDGAPVIGQIERWNPIMSALELLTLHKPVAVWSVAFDPKGGNDKAMKGMADEGFGSYGAPEL